MNPIVPWMAASAVLPYAADFAGRIGQALEVGFAALLGQDGASPTNASGVAAHAAHVAAGHTSVTGPELVRWLELFHRRLAQLVSESGVPTALSLEITIASDGRLTLVEPRPEWWGLQQRVQTDELLRLAYQAIDSIVPNPTMMRSGSSEATSLPQTGAAGPTALRLRWTPEAASVLS